MRINCKVHISKGALSFNVVLNVHFKRNHNFAGKIIT